MNLAAVDVCLHPVITAFDQFLKNYKNCGMEFDHLSKYFALTLLYYYREGESVCRPHQCYSKFSVGASHFLLSSLASYQTRTDESKKSLFVHWNILDH